MMAFLMIWDDTWRKQYLIALVGVSLKQWQTLHLAELPGKVSARPLGCPAARTITAFHLSSALRVGTASLVEELGLDLSVL